MKKTFALLAGAAGLSLAACGTHGGDNASAGNTDLVANDTGLGDLSTNSDSLDENAALPADEGNGTEATNAAAPVGNAF